MPFKNIFKYVKLVIINVKSEKIFATLFLYVFEIFHTREVKNYILIFFVFYLITNSDSKIVRKN